MYLNHENRFNGINWKVIFVFYWQKKRILIEIVKANNQKLEMILMMSFCYKPNLSNPYIFATWWCKGFTFQAKIIWSNRIHNLKNHSSTTLGCKD